MEPDNIFELGEWNYDAYSAKYNKFAKAVREADNKFARAVSDKFSVGDIVALKTGAAPQRVIAVNGNQIRTSYVSSRKELGWRSANDFVRYDFVAYDNALTNQNSAASFEDPLENEKHNTQGDKMIGKLYKITVDGVERFGTCVAIDTDASLVMKMEDTKAFEAFDEALVKRVMPYTFDVEFLSGSTNRQNRYSYKGKEGSVAVGDILLLNDSFSMARVTAINTESESATKKFNGVKLKTEALA